MSRVVPGVLVALLVSACPSRTEPQVVDSGPEPDAGFGVVDAGPPLPVTLTPELSGGLSDGGVVAIVADTEIEPITSMTVALPMPLKDFRIRVLDWRDQVVVSDDELMADGKTYLVTFAEPLKTGHSYRVALDAELGPIVTAESGQEVDDWELKFKIAGEIVPEAPARPSRRKRH